jgi:RHS repeat-associated protein
MYTPIVNKLRGTRPQYTFDGNNHITGAQVYYDAGGNVTTDGPSNQGFHSYTYDGNYRLWQVDAGTTATYTYNAEGRRVSKTGGSTSVNYIYDLSGHQVAEVSSAGVWNRGEVYAGSKHLATYVGGTGGTTYFDLADWLGSERVRTSITGAQVENCTSLPFGDAQTCTGTDESPLHFTGGQWDWESNLTSFWFRSYSTTQGRWLTMDPAGLAAVDITNPQTWNRYAYVANNPLSFTDSTGLNQDGCTPKNGCGPGNSPGSTNSPSFSFSPMGNGSAWSAATITTVYGRWVPLDVINPPTPQSIPGGSVAFALTAGYWDSYSAVTGIGSAYSGNGATSTIGVGSRETQTPGQQLKPGCTGPAFLAGLTAAGTDLIPVPPQFNPDSVGATGDLATSKQGQALAIGVLYQVANGARFLAPAADVAADFVPFAGQVWLAYQVGHALYEGGKAFKESVDQCYGGG